MYNNMITKVEEVINTGYFNNINPFFVFLSSKDGENNVAIVQAKVSYNELQSEIPICSQMWNPIALNTINVTQDLLNIYRIFIGYIE